MKSIIILSLTVMLLAACGNPSYPATTLKVSAPSQGGELSTDEILALYAENQEAIDLVWTGLMTEETSLKEATLQWVAFEKPVATDVILAIYSENQEAIDAIWVAKGDQTTLREATEAWVDQRFDHSQT